MDARGFLAVTGTAAAAFAMCAGAASADPAVVLNPGDETFGCALFAFDGRYTGTSTFIMKDGEQLLLQCHAVLDRGEPVEQTQMIRTTTGGLLVVTPSGIANFTSNARSSP
jgi:hypothetical protein